MASRKFFTQLVKFFQKRPKLIILVKFLPIFSLFWLLSWLRVDPDFGWHLRSGGYIIHNGIPAHDIFSYTAQNFRWIDHEWGNDVIVYGLYSVGGYFWLSILFGLIWSLALFINGFKTRFIALLLAATALLPYAGIRPLGWTVLFFAIGLKLLNSRWRYAKAALILLVFVWANLHAGFIVGLATITYFGLKNRQKNWFWLLALAVVVTFINPYGPRLYEEVFRTLFDPSLHWQIKEWFSASWSKQVLPFVSLWAAGFWLFKRRPLKNWLGLGPLLFVAALSATRNVPLFVVATFRELDSFYDVLKKELPGQARLAKKIVLSFIVLAVTVVTSYMVFRIFYPVKARFSDYPVMAVSYLKAHNCPGHLFNSYNYGGYLIWRLPNVPVYIDGRMTAWQDSGGTRYLDRYYNLLKDNNLRAKEFQRYTVRCALIENDSLHQQLKTNLVKAGWQPRIQANGAVLLQAP